MKSEFKSIEVFITRDGKEFLDERVAQRHEKTLDSRDKLLKMLEIVSQGYGFEVIQYSHEGVTKKLILVDNPGYRELETTIPKIMYQIEEVF